MSELTTIWDDFTGFWTNTVWAGLKSLFQLTVSNEIAALTPIAESVVATLEADLKSVTSLSQLGTLVGSAFSGVASQAEAAGISAAAASLVTVVSSVLGNVLSTPAVVSPASTSTTPPVSAPPAG